MKVLQRAVVNSIMIAAIFGSSAFAVAYADEAGYYSCCGTGSTPLAERCRYTDRSIECETDAACSNNGDYRLCCSDRCFTYPLLE